jgi:hypothetical protein
MLRSLWNLLIEFVAKSLNILACIFGFLAYLPALLAHYLGDARDWLRRRAELEPHNVLDEMKDHGTPCALHRHGPDLSCQACILADRVDGGDGKDY